MIELSNTAAQVVAPGQAVTFNKIIMHTGCGECFSDRAPTSVKMKANGIYEIHFSGNIGGTAAGTPVQLAIVIGTSALPETVMVSTPAAANNFNNVSTQTRIKVCCCDLDRISVVNSGTVPTLLSANMNLSVKRLA